MTTPAEMTLTLTTTQKLFGVIDRKTTEDDLSWFRKTLEPILLGVMFDHTNNAHSIWGL